MYGILFDGAQRLFDGNHGLIYPDFIGKDAGERIIADAKYKPWNNISGKDYLQILAYMFRFDAKRGYYLYPEVTHQADVSLRLNRGMVSTRYRFQALSGGSICSGRCTILQCNSEIV